MDAGDHIFVQSVIGKEPLKVSDEEVLVRFTTFCQNVDKKSHVVMEAYQMEALQTYRKLSEKAVSCQSSTKQFDEFGNPATLVNRNSVHTLLEPFADIYTFDNKDLRKLFAQYLRRHGQENLIPRFENF
jgi:hypothetical protein